MSVESGRQSHHSSNIAFNKVKIRISLIKLQSYIKKAKFIDFFQKQEIEL